MSPGSLMPEYEFRPLDVDANALAQCTPLLETVLSPALNRAYLTWLYAQNPAGGAVGFNAFHDGALVAHYATIPLSARVNGRVESGLLSLNTATRADHQGKGLFPKLAERTYQLAAERGFGFVVGVANARSTRGFTEKLGFQLVAPLDVCVGVGEFDPGGAEGGESYAPQWTDDAIAWRLRRPGSRYVAGAPRSGNCDVFATLSKFRMLACLDRVPAALAESLPHASALTPLRLRIGLDRRAQSRGVFARVPDALKPSPLNLIFRDLGAARRTLDAEHVRWTLLDFDAY
jgi:GNAT superfamily N-acetyltransferase